MTDKKTSTSKDKAKTTANAVKDSVEATGLAAPSVSDVEKARAEGVSEAIKDDAKSAYKFATDGRQPGTEPTAPQFTGSDQHTNMIGGMLSLGPDALEAAVSDEAPVPMSEGQVANLLKLERNGPNRTQHVKILCKRLGVKSPLEVPGAGGPAYTNDVSNVTPVDRSGD